MSVRIRWKTGTLEGAFHLRSAPLHLVWAEEGLDRVSRQPSDEEDGLTLDPPDPEGFIAIRAYGELRLLAGERATNRGRLPLGKALAFEVEDERGQLQAEGGRDPLVGKEIGGYRILSRLGAGAVGVVYRALQINLEREVALKMLNDEALKDPKMVASFRREAKAAGKLVHPNVVQVYDVGEEDGRHFYSMELIRGGSLEDRLQEQGPLDWQDAVAALRDTARALAFAEEHQMVHRDVKPENLMVMEDGHVKLADLGLAATRGMAHKEAAGGTPHFMAPEAIGKAPIDHRADLYSLGCTFYRLATGETPFEGETVRDILRAHRDEPSPSLRDAGVTAPKTVEGLLTEMLEKDPDRRPEHASEVVTGCERALRGSSSKALVVVLGVLLVGAGAWAAFQATRDDPEPAEPEKVVEYVQDPNAAKTAAQMEALKAENAFMQAKANADPKARMEALETFVLEYPDSERTEEARELANDIRARLQAEEESQQAEANALEAATTGLISDVDDLLAARTYGAALAKITSVTESVDAAVVSEQRERVLQAAEQALGDWSGQHEQALQQEDWAQARSIRSTIADGIASESEIPEAWSTLAEQLASAADEAERKALDRDFRAARQAFLAVLQGEVESSLEKMELQPAENAYRSAGADCPHPELREAIQADDELFSAAARAVASMKARLESGEELTMTHPVSNKRAVLLRLDDQGVRVRVQVRGERVEQTDPWPPFLTPAALTTLTRALMPADAQAEETLALKVLVAHHRLSQAVRAWSGAIPSRAQAGQLAADARAWLESFGAPDEADPAWLAPHRAAIEALSAVGDALADDDAYLAMLLLEGFTSRYSLLAAWISDGSGLWGMQP